MNDFGALRAPRDDNVTMGTTSIAPGGTFTSATRSGHSDAAVMHFLLNLASPAQILDVYVDTSIDGGTDWVNVAHVQRAAGALATLVGFTLRRAVALAITVDVTGDLAANTLREGYIGEMFRVRITMGAGAGGASTHTVFSAWSGRA